ncbi:hypothetical protein ACFV4Q_20125 [Streptomyces nojiriensis]|uniref:hypothetical protein n=1 Tax=Streptomyces nojiriensis TaxID=66374 RepID=UPI003659073E
MAVRMKPSEEGTIVIATSERVRGYGLDPDRLIWHVPVGVVVEDFRAIACSDEEGLAVSSGERDVPLCLEVPDQSWCPRCLSLVPAAHE